MSLLTANGTLQSKVTVKLRIRTSSDISVNKVNGIPQDLVLLPGTSWRLHNYLRQPIQRVFNLNLGV